MSQMIPNVTRVRGSHLIDNPENPNRCDYIEVEIEGVFQFRTDDPEEFIQDIVIRDDKGQIVYLDEQTVRVVA